MRKLTIQRTKSFVASLISMKVYIEDRVQSEITINNTPCRKIGTLKNGETKEFFIDNNECKVFVIADTLSKSYCNEFYPIPAGEGDIFLSGKNHYNPANGNAFLFDGVTDEEVLKNRKKGTKKGIIVLVAALLVGFALGLFLAFSDDIFSDDSPKDFTVEDMTITLTGNFEEMNVPYFDAGYYYDDLEIAILCEKFSEYPELKEYDTLDEYMEDILKHISADEEKVEAQKKDGLTYYEYTWTDTDVNEVYCYYEYVYMTDDAFWTVSFAIDDEDVEKYRDSIHEWAGTVRFE